ncbi:hypothetical protein BGZ97_011406 [Linnemannia gamsii]|uniref:RNI-like protein n=1 Tax=Linnemannia gamsii TaxID=64522 RepID=A0A9P6RIZ8_9FUNG|nr:hypothetical protein BGZ97_011406 [Linnemannia gamsii]
MIRFLKRNTSLQTVRLDGFPLDDDGMCKLLSDALETHPWLGDLEINGGDSAQPSSVAYILRGVVRSPRVSALKMVSHLCFDPNIHEPEYNILLLALLRHSPHLERLSFILPTSNQQHLKHFISALSEFPKLRHLELVEYSTTTDTDTDYPTDLILASSSASAHLQSFTLRSSQTRPTLPPPFGARGVQALAHHQHSRTLERLDFRNCGKVESKDLQLLLTSCPHLIEFMAIDAEAPSREQNRSRIHVTDLAASGAWVCGGLRELHIGFTGFATLTPTSNESGSAVKYYTNLIYTRLASLPALKTLCLAGGELLPPSPSLTTDQWIAYFDLSLKTGLSKLATLKKLETLNLSQMTHLRIGKAEAAWMVENWRRLCSVTLPVQDPVTMEEEYRATAARHFVNLICVRPTLTVSIFV